MKVRKIFCGILFCIIILISGCGKDLSLNNGSDSGQPRGSLVSSQQILDISPATLKGLLAGAGLDTLPVPQFGVKAYAIQYSSIDPHGRAVTASAALMVPQTKAAFPLLSLQHGTVTHRDQVASRGPLNSAEGSLALVTASLGYLTCVPDYLGLGDSQMIHPYHHAASSASAVIDCIRAVRAYCLQEGVDLDAQLFLAGYSEGGYVTMAAQREMEKSYPEEFTITACAPMAGAFDLRSTARGILQQQTYGSTIYLAFILVAYNDVYGWNRLDEMFRPPYAGEVEDLFDGSHYYSEIQASLPDRIDSLLTAVFIDEVINASNPEVETALSENTLLNWTPKAPLRLYHGDADQTVFYQNSLTARDSLAGAELVTIPGGTHTSAAIPAFVGALTWFETFR